LGVLSEGDSLRCHDFIYFVKKKEENFGGKIRETTPPYPRGKVDCGLTFVLFNRHLVVFSATSPYQGDYR
jgi:hypothetical protein